MKTKLKVVRILAIVGLLAGRLALFNAASETAASQQLEVIASGLDNPRGLAFGPEGALYVVEAGRGGTGPCTDWELFGDILCYGPTGAVTRVWRGSQTRIATDLSSLAHPDGGFAFGPHDISFHGRGDAYVTVGTCTPSPTPEALSGSCGKLIRLPASGQWREVADLFGYEILNNPDGANEGEHNPYGVLALAGERIATDAAWNDLLRIAPNGSISTLAVFPQRFVEYPPGSGAQVLMDAVPTSVARGPDGAYYVGQLTGFPFPVGDASVYRVPAQGGVPEVFEGGFTGIIDVTFGPDGSLYVLELAKNGLLAGFEGGDWSGALIRVAPDGTRSEIAPGALWAPGGVALGVALGDDGAIYVTNNSIYSGTGQVLRIGP